MLLYVSADQKLFGHVLISVGYVLLAVCSTTRQTNPDADNKK